MAILPLNTALPLLPTSGDIEDLKRYLGFLTSALQQRIDEMVFYYNDMVTNYNATDNQRPSEPPIDEMIGWDTVTNIGYAAVNGVWIPLTGLAGAPITVTTTPTTITYSNGLVQADATAANLTLNLPTAVGVSNKTFTFVKTDATANTVTIDANSTETISGNLTFTLTAQWQAVTIISNGANWIVI